MAADLPQLPDDYDHDPTLEPWASMSREAILAEIAAETDGDRYAFLMEFLRDKMTRKELQTENHAMRIAKLLIEEYDAYGNAQCVYLCKQAGKLAAEIVEAMPAFGPAHEVN